MQGGRAGWWASALPILACAVCPACLATYAKLLSVFGIGIGLTEDQHLALLLIALAISLGVSAVRSWEAKRVWPIAIAFVGGALLLLGHFGEMEALEWGGAAVLLLGGISEQVRMRRVQRMAVQVEAIVLPASKSR